MAYLVEVGTQPQNLPTTLGNVPILTIFVAPGPTTCTLMELLALIVSTGPLSS